MKPFLVAHGEKLFFLVVILVGGWSLFGSALSFTKSPLNLDVERKIREILDIMNRKVPEKEPVADYAGRLQEGFDGMGRYEEVGTRMDRLAATRLWYEPPYSLTPVERIPEQVTAALSEPQVLKATPFRGRVSIEIREATVKYAEVTGYEIYRMKEGTQWDAQPARVIPAFRSGFVWDDTDVEPETTYAYRARTVGKKQELRGTKVQPPPNLAVDAEGVWYTGFTKTVSAKTPSNITFFCTGLLDDMGQWRALITIYKWSNDRNDWDDFKTDYPRRPGIAIGEVVKGRRSAGTGRFEEFDSGYVVKDIRPNVRYTDGGLQKRRQEIDIKHPGTGREMTLIVGEKEPLSSGGPVAPVAPTPGPAAAPGPAPAAGTIGDMVARMNRGGERTQATVVASGGDPKLRLRSGSLPTGWQEMARGEVNALDYGQTVTPLLRRGAVGGAKGSLPGLFCVLQDMVLANLKAGDASAVEDLAKNTALKEMLGIAGAKQRGDYKAMKNHAGQPIGVVAADIPSGDGEPWVWTRYCGNSGNHLLILNFVCRESERSKHVAFYDYLGTGCMEW